MKILKFVNFALTSLLVCGAQAYGGESPENIVLRCKEALGAKASQFKAERNFDFSSAVLLAFRTEKNVIVESPEQLRSFCRDIAESCG